MLQVREPNYLGLTVQSPDGDVRCSPREADELAVPLSLVFRTDERGFGPAEFVLARPEGDEGFAQADRVRRWQGAPVLAWDQAGRGVHESRITKVAPGASEIHLETEGFAKSLEDDGSARLLGIDGDLNSWGPMSRARKIALITGGVGANDPQVSSDTANGLPALFLEHIGNWDSTATPAAEAMYEYAGLNIARIVGSVQWGLAFATSGFSAYVGSADDDVHTNRQQTSDLTTGTATGTASFDHTPTTAKAVGLLRWLWEAGGADQTGLDNLHFAAAFRDVKVLGDHGLTLRGTSPDQGYYASDLAEYVVGRWGPLLNVNTRSIEPTSFVIPQWVQKEDTTAAAMLDSLALFGGNNYLPLDWWVYDDRTFGMASPDNHGRVWRMRLDEAVEQEDAGDDIAGRVSGVKVSYTDGAGTTHTVGPPGSGSETETTDLQDTRPDNPVNYSKGFAGKIEPVSMGITYEDGAILMGQVVMADRNRRRWSGDVLVKGPVREHGSGGAEEPNYMVRGFDRGVVEDDPDTAERRITATEYDSKTQVLKATVGQSPELFPALAARAGVVLEGKL